MDELDLDAFIANIEESAPQEEFDPTQLRCKECDTILENTDDEFVCPNCSAQPTNILQIEETELQFTADGHAIAGQRVRIEKRKKTEDIDYGWAWSTDEAIAHILKLQIDSLERINVVDERFRPACTNMWTKFWVENVAIYIKDEYNEQELTPLKYLKHRDIEVLVKCNDKILVPITNPPTKEHDQNMMGIRFYRSRKNSSRTEHTQANHEESEESSSEIEQSEAERVTELEGTSNQAAIEIMQFPRARLKKDSISILTLDRTLAFLEAAARLLNLDLLASDIVRACTQRLIPFFGAHKTLPKNFKLNKKDRSLFVKIKPPTPTQLVKAASLLIYRTYNENLPIKIPSPDFERILLRFINDMNLPYDILTHVKHQRIDFSSFFQTRYTPIRHGHKQGNFPLYDRWAFCILLSQLKHLFILDCSSIRKQRRAANRQIRKDNSKVFIFQDWIKQISMRLNLIMSYDPYVLFHPMTNLKDLQPTPQVYNYVSTFMGDKVKADIRSTPVTRIFDESIRSELTEFLHLKIPKPTDVESQTHDEPVLEKSYNVQFPMSDAFTRTKRFWMSDISHDQIVTDILFKDFKDDKILTIRRKRVWTVYDDQDPTKSKLSLLPTWPQCFRLLLSVGGYLCLCQPHDLLHEFKKVEKLLYPKVAQFKKTKTAKQDEIQ